MKLFSLVSLQLVFSDLKILVYTSLFNESFSLQRLGPVCSSASILTLSKLQKSLDLALYKLIWSDSFRENILLLLAKIDLLMVSEHLARDNKRLGIALTT